MQSKTNVLSGENVTYTYDPISLAAQRISLCGLNKLATSQTTQTPTTAAPQWGDSYTFDGFGNLTDVTPIGTGLNYHTTFNAATNRETGGAYDANGNANGSMAYDVDNRAVNTVSQVAGPGATYGYAPDNKRILKSDFSTPVETHLFFHGLGGERLGEYRFNFTISGTALSIDLVTGNTWFGGKLLREGDWLTVQDAKGSVRWRKNVLTNATETADYYPFGQEKPSTTTQNREKFGTYVRDAETGLDYADQRYFSSTSGRFMTADPYQASGGPGKPGSWNRYAYVEGDPVNSYDPNGLQQCPPGIDFCATGTAPSPRAELPFISTPAFIHLSLSEQDDVHPSTAMERFGQLDGNCQNGLRDAMSAPSDKVGAQNRLAALDRLGKQDQGFQVLKGAAAAAGIDWRILAALTIMESNGGSRLTQSGGAGLGWFHIDMNANPGLESTANDYAKAAQFAANTLAANAANIKAFIGANGGEVSNDTLAWMMMASWNTGTAGQESRWLNGQSPDYHTSPRGDGTYGGRYGVAIAELTNCF